MAGRILILILFFFASFPLFSQTNVSRKQLRENNKAIHDRLHFEKYNITTVDLSSELKLKMQKLERIRKLLEVLKTQKESFHFLTIETVSGTYLKNQFTRKTFGLEAQSAGIKLPKIMVLLPQIEPYTMYRDYIPVAGINYLSPLYNPRYYSIDTISASDDMLQLAFTPNRKRNYLLTGVLQVEPSTGQIGYFKGYSSSGMNTELIYTAEKTDSIYLPAKLVTKITVGKKDDVVIESKSSFNNYSKLTDQDSITFNAVVIDNDLLLNTENVRIDYFHLDSTYGKDFENTEKIFNTLLEQSKTQALYDDIALITQGKIPLYFVNIRANKLINFNSYEGFRPGIGLESNPRVSNLFTVGGYVGIGLKDKALKYNADLDIHIHKPSLTHVSLEYTNDLYEPGEYRYPFSTKPFGNEGFRKFGLSNIERDENFTFSLSSSYLKWISINLKSELGKATPLFDYNYLPVPGSDSYSYKKSSVTLRIIPREQFMKAFHKYISLGSKFPAFWINYERGTVSDMNYKKYNFKAEKRFKFVSFGEFTMDVLAGSVNKDLPYPFLYNLHGSYRPGTPIINNSFITMRYNEFMAQKYLALHVNHNFGKLRTGSPSFKPEPIILHNMGIGVLPDSGNHELVNNISIEKGYFESGFYFKNLIAFQHVVGQTGIGAGFMFRYGPYALKPFNNNLVFKFSIDIEI